MADEESATADRRPTRGGPSVDWAADASGTSASSKQDKRNLLGEHLAAVSFAAKLKGKAAVTRAKVMAEDVARECAPVPPAS